MKQPPPTGLYVANWGLLGWVETALKEVAILAGILAFFATNGLPLLAVGEHPRPVLLFMLAALTIAMVFQLGFRVVQRELISIAFAVTMLLGHAALLVSVLRAGDIRAYGLTFALFLLLGDLTKHRFLSDTGYTEGGQTTTAMLRIVRGVIISDIVLGLLFLR